MNLWQGLLAYLTSFCQNGNNSLFIIIVANSAGLLHMQEGLDHCIPSTSSAESSTQIHIAYCPPADEALRIPVVLAKSY